MTSASVPPEGAGSVPPKGPGGGEARPARPGRRLRPGLVLVLLAVALAGLGPPVAGLAFDFFGPTFTYYDNGRTVELSRSHLRAVSRLPGGGLGLEWPECVLRPACLATLDLLGLAGPEGGEWTAGMEGEGPGCRLVVRTADGTLAGVYRLTGGEEETGLVVVEVDAGLRGLFLLDVLQPVEGGTWFVVRVWEVPR
ncbi:MAG: hypothetical protein K6U08_04135 [Firmicutes bacterium]|nr:hypothetical protein [Bacillota bacterium]